jgi:hypothetical protein
MKKGLRGVRAYRQNDNHGPTSATPRRIEAPLPTKFSSVISSHRVAAAVFCEREPWPRCIACQRRPRPERQME